MFVSVPEKDTSRARGSRIPSGCQPERTRSFNPAGTIRFGKLICSPVVTLNKAGAVTGPSTSQVKERVSALPELVIVPPPATPDRPHVTGHVTGQETAAPEPIVIFELCCVGSYQFG